MAAKAELGEKRRCLTCSAPFFDLNRTPIVCPKCAAVFQVVELVRSSAKYSPMRKPQYKTTGPATPIAADDVLLSDEELVDAGDDAEDAVEESGQEDDVEDVEATI